MRRFIVLFSVLVAVMVLTGCADGGNAQEDVDVENSKNETASSNEDAENGNSNEGANDSGNEAEEGEEEAELTVEEAQEIVFDHYLARLVEMDELMDDVHQREDTMLIYDERTEEFAAFEKEVAEVFEPFVSQDSLQKFAETHAAMYTCECDAYKKIAPSEVNVNFELLEQDGEMGCINGLDRVW